MSTITMTNEEAAEFVTFLESATPNLAIDLSSITSRTFVSGAVSITLSQSIDRLVIDDGTAVIGEVRPDNESYEAIHAAMYDPGSKGTLTSLLDGSLLAKPAPMAKIDFMQLFTLDELVDIEDLQKGDAGAGIVQNKSVRTAMTMLDAADKVDLSRQSVTGFIAYLRSLDSPNRTGKKVLTAARANRVLSGREPA